MILDQWGRPIRSLNRLESPEWLKRETLERVRDVLGMAPEKRIILPTDAPWPSGPHGVKIENA